jgi:hypothetical protein
MLNEAFVGAPAPTTSPGVNATKQLEFEGGAIAFHKPFSGVHVANAIAYGQTDETPPLHEAASWRLAVALGPPWDEIVVPCVLREYAGQDGSLSLRAIGWPRDTAPTLNPTWCPARGVLRLADRAAGPSRRELALGRQSADSDRSRLHLRAATSHPQLLRLRGFSPRARRRKSAHGGAQRAHQPAQQLRPARNGAVPPACPRAGTGRQGTAHAAKRRDPASRRVLRCPPCVRYAMVVS